MGIPLREIIKQLPLEEQKEIEKRSAELLAEEMTRQQLKQALKLTQEQIAKHLQIDQGNVSRLEQRTDLMLSTLRKYVEAMGGELRLVVEFPNCPPVTLVGISDIEEPEEAST
ncbi:XRE family transcriptional regulator [Iningainema tapete]|uniref:XRE family transcriptional regulator n=1 Tax=Iningainema tapete BLCC-T55 TaxID=2748662 RepID=A0A8J7CGV3_9CYAN|nr:XRE family transcriptional regulator [Iningainema tapete]MBD2776880.1 XRE family transcriptional regulator [Iningainema tapete BLCC-T55]